jgi:hypothetical protein
MHTPLANHNSFDFRLARGKAGLVAGTRAIHLYYGFTPATE